MAWREPLLFKSHYCALPICNCDLEKKVVDEHQFYHIGESSKYYKNYKTERGTNDIANRKWSDEPVDLLVEKQKYQKGSSSPDEIQAYIPIIYDKIDPSEVYLESDKRIGDNKFRTSQKSTLTCMLPIRPLLVQRKEADWGNYQEAVQKEYTIKPPGPGRFYSMMTSVEQRACYCPVYSKLDGKSPFYTDGTIWMNPSFHLAARPPLECSQGLAFEFPQPLFYSRPGVVT